MEIKSIIAEVEKEFCDMPLSHTVGLLNRRVIRIELTQEMVIERLLCGVWSRCIGQLNEQFPETEPLTLERALEELKKRDEMKGRIIRKKDSLRLNLSNWQYRVYRLGGIAGTCACPWPSEWRYLINISAERFVGFIIWFDEMIPEMRNYVPGLLQMLQNKELEEKKEELVRKIEGIAARSLK